MAKWYQGNSTPFLKKSNGFFVLKSTKWKEHLIGYIRGEIFKRKQKVPELEIPVYFFGGIYDYTCSYTLARDYLEKLQAPMKGFYTFELSAHSPLFEEPQKAQRILQEDVLAGTNNLADAR